MKFRFLKWLRLRLIVAIERIDNLIGRDCDCHSGNPCGADCYDHENRICPTCGRVTVETGSFNDSNLGEI